MTEEKKTIRKEKKNGTKKKKPLLNNSLGGMKMWLAVMFIYLLLFGYIGFIAFWPMAFNDPDNTVKKYLTILEEHQAKTNSAETEEGKIFKLAIEELMKKAEDSANDLQKLASQSFNIVLGAFLAFLSATVTTLFQGAGKRDDEPEPEEELQAA